MLLPRLKACRERALLTQAELAAKTGLTEVTISRLENGHRSARIPTVRKLAEALSVQPSELMAPEQSE